MIDTICLHTSNFNILNINKNLFTVIKTNNNHFLADTFYGISAIYKTDYLNIKIDLTGLYINIPSLPFYFYKDKTILKSIDTDTLLSDVFNKLGRELTGIILIKPEDIYKFNVSRLDLFKDIELNNPYHLYTDFLKSINGKYFHTKQWSDTIAFSNNSVETIFYNKKLQLQQIHGIDLPLDNDLLRCEIKLKKRYNVKKTGNIDTTADISIEHLQSIFTDLLRDRIFDYGEDKNIKKHNTTDYKELEKEILYTGLLSYFNNDLKEIKKYYENQNVSRQTISKKLKEIKKYSLMADTSFAEIKQELEDKLYFNKNIY